MVTIDSNLHRFAQMRPEAMIERSWPRWFTRLPACHGSPQIQRSLRELRVLTQGLPRGPRGADEPRAIAKPAGCDGNGS
jgi:hypothetical protein